MNYDNNILGSYEAYIKGNMFKNEYDKYKNYNIEKLIPNSEKGELLLNINQIGFMINDLRLYLDVHPDNKPLISLYNKYINEYNKLLDEYQKKYKILECNTISNSDYFTWEEESFPWEV